jgi:hypothetical protein
VKPGVERKAAPGAPLAVATGAGWTEVRQPRCRLAAPELLPAARAGAAPCSSSSFPATRRSTSSAAAVAPAPAKGPSTGASAASLDGSPSASLSEVDSTWAGGWGQGGRPHREAPARGA